MKIFLIGFMGAGKSTVGKKLSALLDLPFVDSDKSIELELGMTVSEIFQKKGEAFFRSYERKWLEKLRSENGVYALGGGTPCSKENIDLVKELGTSVYLKLAPKMLVTRLESAKTERPLLDPYKNDPEALLRFVEEKLSEREVYYNQANVHFDASSVNPEKLLNLKKIIELAP